MHRYTYANIRTYQLDLQAACVTCQILSRVATTPIRIPTKVAADTEVDMGWVMEQVWGQVDSTSVKKIFKNSAGQVVRNLDP